MAKISTSARNKFIGEQLDLFSDLDLRDLVPPPGYAPQEAAQQPQAAQAVAAPAVQEAPAVREEQTPISPAPEPIANEAADAPAAVVDAPSAEAPNEEPSAAPDETHLFSEGVEMRFLEKLGDEPDDEVVADIVEHIQNGGAFNFSTRIFDERICLMHYLAEGADLKNIAALFEASKDKPAQLANLQESLLGRDSSGTTAFDVALSNIKFAVSTDARSPTEDPSIAVVRVLAEQVPNFTSVASKTKDIIAAAMEARPDSSGTSLEQDAQYALLGRLGEYVAEREKQAFAANTTPTAAHEKALALAANLRFTSPEAQPDEYKKRLTELCVAIKDIGPAINTPLPVEIYRQHVAEKEAADPSLITPDVAKNLSDIVYVISKDRADSLTTANKESLDEFFKMLAFQFQQMKPRSAKDIGQLLSLCVAQVEVNQQLQGLPESEQDALINYALAKDGDPHRQAQKALANEDAVTSIRCIRVCLGSEEKPRTNTKNNVNHVVGVLAAAYHTAFKANPDITLDQALVKASSFEGMRDKIVAGKEQEFLAAVASLGRVLRQGDDKEAEHLFSVMTTVCEVPNLSESFGKHYDALLSAGSLQKFATADAMRASFQRKHRAIDEQALIEGIKSPSDQARAALIDSTINTTQAKNNITTIANHAVSLLDKGLDIAALKEIITQTQAVLDAHYVEAQKQANRNSGRLVAEGVFATLAHAPEDARNRIGQAMIAAGMDVKASVGRMTPDGARSLRFMDIDDDGSFYDACASADEEFNTALGSACLAIATGEPFNHAPNKGFAPLQNQMVQVSELLKKEHPELSMGAKTVVLHALGQALSFKYDLLEKGNLGASKDAPYSLSVPPVFNGELSAELVGAFKGVCDHVRQNNDSWMRKALGDELSYHSGLNQIGGHPAVKRKGREAPEDPGIAAMLPAGKRFDVTLSQGTAIVTLNTTAQDLVVMRDMAREAHLSHKTESPSTPKSSAKLTYPKMQLPKDFPQAPLVVKKNAESDICIIVPPRQRSEEGTSATGSEPSPVVNGILLDTLRECGVIRTEAAFYTVPAGKAEAIQRVYNEKMAHQASIGNVRYEDLMFAPQTNNPVCLTVNDVMRGYFNDAARHVLAENGIPVTSAPEEGRGPVVPAPLYLDVVRKAQELMLDASAQHLPEGVTRDNADARQMAIAFCKTLIAGAKQLDSNLMQAYGRDTLGDDAHKAMLFMLDSADPVLTHKHDVRIKTYDALPAATRDEDYEEIEYVYKGLLEEQFEDMIALGMLEKIRNDPNPPAKEIRAEVTAKASNEREAAPQAMRLAG